MRSKNHILKTRKINITETNKFLDNIANTIICSPSCAYVLQNEYVSIAKSCKYDY